MNIKDIRQKIDISLNTKPEKAIVATSLATAMAILTISAKKKKGKPNFFQRIGKYYSSIDKLLVSTIAKNAAAEEKRRAVMAEFSNKKLRDMEIEKSIPIDLSDIEDKAEKDNND